MNYLRSKKKNISLASIDFESNAMDYALFNKENQGKTIDELKEELNKYSYNNYLAILENGTNKMIGIVGFKNKIESNRRANIDLIFSDELEYEKKITYGKEALDGVSDYAYYSLNLYNLLCEETNLKLADMYKDAGFEYIGARHNTILEDNKLNDLYFFQKMPKKVSTHNGLEIMPSSIITPNKLSIDALPQMSINGVVTLVKPSALDESDIEHTKIMLANSFNNPYDAACMGESKVIYNDFRLNKKFDDKTGFDYFILDESGKPIGYVDRLHLNNKNLSTDVEINIFDSEKRGKGYGKAACEAYVDVLRKAGYVSIGSVVFGFNSPSMKLHRSTGFNEYALRDESYYALGKLQDMHYYEADTSKLEKGSKK